MRSMKVKELHHLGVYVIRPMTGVGPAVNFEQFISNKRLRRKTGHSRLIWNLSETFPPPPILFILFFPLLIVGLGYFYDTNWGQNEMSSMEALSWSSRSQSCSPRDRERAFSSAWATGGVWGFQAGTRSLLWPSFSLLPAHNPLREAVEEREGYGERETPLLCWELSWLQWAVYAGKALTDPLRQSASPRLVGWGVKYSSSS